MGDLFGIRMCAAYTAESRITFNLEYHFNQAGFACADWRNWFAAGHASPGDSPVVSELPCSALHEQ